MSRVLIIDTRLCNLRSITRAVEECGGTSFVGDRPRDLDKASHVILPGVGAFPAAMQNLAATGMDQGLKERAREGMPLLGICLGMQLLAGRGLEVRETEGLGLVPGEVRMLQPGSGERIPHIGWDEVDLRRPHPLFQGIESGRDFYFVHSWAFAAADRDDVMATTPAFGTFTAAVARDNVVGVQFHPEKSQRPGLQLLGNFIGSR
jgi:glutamine amidotransferase